MKIPREFLQNGGDVLSGRTNITTQIGSSAILPCVVKQVGSNTVRKLHFEYGNIYMHKQVSFNYSFPAIDKIVILTWQINQSKIIDMSSKNSAIEKLGSVIFETSIDVNNFNITE